MDVNTIVGLVFAVIGALFMLVMFGIGWFVGEVIEEVIKEPEKTGSTDSLLH